MKMLFLLSLSFLLFSCKKSKENNNPDHINATITISGNSHFVDNDLTPTIGRFTVPLFGTPYIGIKGWTSLTSNLSIQLPPTVLQGTYDITASGPYTASYYDGATSTSYYSVESSGTITKDSFTGSHIKGTFQFNCYNSTSQEAKITNGSFEGDL